MHAEVAQAPGGEREVATKRSPEALAHRACLSLTRHSRAPDNIGAPVSARGPGLGGRLQLRLDREPLPDHRLDETGLRRGESAAQGLVTLIPGCQPRVSYGKRLQKEKRAPQYPQAPPRPFTQQLLWVSRQDPGRNSWE